MCKFNIKITIVQPLRLTNVFAKSKIHTSRCDYSLPGISIVLEIKAALLFISVTSSVYFPQLCTHCEPICYSYTPTTQRHSVQCTTTKNSGIKGNTQLVSHPERTYVMVFRRLQTQIYFWVVLPYAQKARQREPTTGNTSYFCTCRLSTQ